MWSFSAQFCNPFTIYKWKSLQFTSEKVYNLQVKKFTIYKFQAASLNHINLYVLTCI
jgi:hypothetical protein